jgi:hypothetical protein
LDFFRHIAHEKTNSMIVCRTIGGPSGWPLAPSDDSLIELCHGDLSVRREDIEGCAQGKTQAQSADEHSRTGDVEESFAGALRKSELRGCDGAGHEHSPIDQNHEIAFTTTTKLKEPFIGVHGVEL